MADNGYLEILSDLLKTAERNFEATVKHATTVDDKAQKTSALASGFLAVAYGFVKPESLQELQKDFGVVALILLYTILVLFLTSVGLCLRAMWLRKVPVGGISLTAHERAARAVLDVTHDVPDEVMAAYREVQIEVWKAAINERHDANIEKTRLVHHAQRLLALGIVAAALTVALLGFAARQSAIRSNRGGRPMPKQEHIQQEPTPKPQAGVEPLEGSPVLDETVELKRALARKTQDEIIRRLRDASFAHSLISDLDRAE